MIRGERGAQPDEFKRTLDARCDGQCNHWVRVPEVSNRLPEFVGTDLVLTRPDLAMERVAELAGASS